MRILYFSQYFPPEIGATQSRAFEMSTHLAKMGHEVTVITEVPNHPAGIIHQQYRRKLYLSSEENGVKIIRVWVKASPEKRFHNRIWFYLSYMLNSSLAGLLLSRNRYDIIIATSPPLFVGGSALCLHYLKRIPFIFEVRDLWPESAVKLGEIRNKNLINFATKFEDMCYSHAQKIIVVTNGIYQNLINRGIEQEKLMLIQNGANIDLFRYKPVAREQIRKKLALEDSFVVIYAGIFGIAQGLETMISTASLLQDFHNIHFLMVGEGPTKNNIEQMIRYENLTNVTILPEQPTNVISEYLSAADVSVVPLRKLELFKGALPTKIFDSWACERPLVISIDGEARDLLEKAQGGVYASPENPVELKEQLLYLRENQTLREKMGKNGRKFTEKYYSREILAKKLEITLRESVNSV